MSDIKKVVGEYQEKKFQFDRITRRLEKASLAGLKRFADAFEVLDNDQLDSIALEAERMAISNMEASLKDEESDTRKSRAWKKIVKIITGG